MVSGLGTNRGAFEIRRVITNLGVFDFESEDGGMRARSLHPGIDPETVANATGFMIQDLELAPATREPSDEESVWLNRLDPDRKVRGALT